VPAGTGDFSPGLNAVSSDVPGRFPGQPRFYDRCPDTKRQQHSRGDGSGRSLLVYGRVAGGKPLEPFK